MTGAAAALRYRATHEWVRDQGDGRVQVGISEHAQQELGEVVFVELPALGSEVKAGNECAVIESVKTAAEIYAPVSGEITAVNTELEDAPEKVNEDPCGAGWLLEIRYNKPQELEQLLSEAAYQESLQASTKDA